MIYEMSKVPEAVEFLNEFSKREKIYLFGGVPPAEPLLEVDATDSMDLESFLTLAKNLDCKILYYHKREFLIDDEWEKYFEYLYKGGDGKWDKRIKEPLSIEIIFYYNGVSHIFKVEESWLEDYDYWVENLKKDEDFFVKKTKRLEQNKEKWCSVIARDTKFQHAKSFAARATIALKLLPELKEYGPAQYLTVRGCNFEFTGLIDNSMEMVEGILRDQVQDLDNQGKAGRFISNILDISKNKVRRILEKLKIE